MLSHDRWSYGSLPDAVIWWCLRTGGGGVVTSLPGLLSQPKCYKYFTRVDISLGSHPLIPHYLGELMAFQVKRTSFPIPLSIWVTANQLFYQIQKRNLPVCNHQIRCETKQHRRIDYFTLTFAPWHERIHQGDQGYVGRGEAGGE